jgi:hypothetical protein
MEYAPGEDLQSYVVSRGVTLPEVSALMVQLLDALQYAHDAGVIHRDIKPANLLVSDRLKIMDFGIARLDSSNLTQEGATMGTPSYMAPEQYTGTGIDHRVDLFAAGVVFYELCTGRLPFEGGTLHEVGYKVCHVEPVLPSRLSPALPAAVDAVVVRALAKDREARFRSAAELSRAIAGAVSGHERAPAIPSVVPAVPAVASGTVGSTSRTLTAPVGPWQPEALRALEAVLAPAVGPLAGALVRRAAARTADPEQLALLLSSGVDEGAARARVIGALRAALGLAPPAAAPAAGPGSTVRMAGQGEVGERPRTIGEQMRGFTREDLERVSQILAGFLGPIAKILVQKAAQNAKSYREVCLKVSERLATPEERARFLQQVNAA